MDLAIRGRKVGFPYIEPELQVPIRVEPVLPACEMDGFIVRCGSGDKCIKLLEPGRGGHGARHNQVVMDGFFFTCGSVDKRIELLEPGRGGHSRIDPSSCRQLAAALSAAALLQPAGAPESRLPVA